MSITWISNKNVTLPPPAFAALLSSPTPSLKAVKVCAVVCPKDAEMIVAAAKEVLPANIELLIGMILWPNSRRSINKTTAYQISTVAARLGAQPVAVFVDETVKQMHDTCREIGVEVAQLHGPMCRSHWIHDAYDTKLKCIDVRDVTSDGTVSTPTSSPRGPALWTIFDAEGGGTGYAFDWNIFKPPKHPWLLAGGLNSQNVGNAIRKMRPSGVDVATGVTSSDKCRKDEARLYEFLTTVVRSYSQ
ncbi:unnamed protein product [Agarophyton chilense]